MKPQSLFKSANFMQTTEGEPIPDAGTTNHPIVPANVLVAHTGEVEGVYNNDTNSLRPVSVVCPLEVGYALWVG
ncbi:MAG: hypothetical protein HEQ39_18200 [Rhizobacter sp.]